MPAASPRWGFGPGDEVEDDDRDGDAVAVTDSLRDAHVAASGDESTAAVARLYCYVSS